MKSLAALIFALALVACTSPTPEGPAENAARPCDFEALEDYCPDCTFQRHEDGAGHLVQASATNLELGEQYERVYDESGALIYVMESSRVVYGCAEGVIIYVHNPVAGLDRCWNTEGVAYHCSGPPPSWARAVKVALDRAEPGPTR